MDRSELQPLTEELSMAISEGTVRKLMETMKAEFSIQLNVKQKWPFWQRRLVEEGIADDEIDPLYRTFARTRNKPGKPNLSEFLQFARRNARVRRQYGIGAGHGNPAPPHVALASLRRIKEKLALFGKGTRADDAPEDEGSKRQELQEQAQEIKKEYKPAPWLQGVEDVPDSEIPFG